MSNESRRRKVKHAILRSRFPGKACMARAYLRAVERYRSLRGARENALHANGLPVPPPRLRALVGPTVSMDWFLASGEAQADYLRYVASDAGQPLTSAQSMLDFGCGCGRIARWFSNAADPDVSGCDYNRDLAAWCKSNLAFMDVRTTRLEPPLPYLDGSFDFLYAFSVFTHLSLDLASRWIGELARVIKPGGLVWFTLHGESYRERLAPDEKARFDAGEIVVWLPEIAGTNLCGAYWPDTAVHRMLGERFSVLRHFDPKVDTETARRIYLEHDAYLVRRASWELASPFR